MPISRLIVLASLSLLIIGGLLSLTSADDAPSDSMVGLPDRAQGEPMTVERIDAIIGVIDPSAERDGSLLTFQYVTEDDVAVTGQIISDVEADRMRIIVGVAAQDILSPELMTRILQANFDSALDARYAIAQGYLWSTFIRPLSSLTDEDFISGLGQSITLSLTFGTTFTSGALVYGGGDSSGIEEDILEELRKKAKPSI